MYVIFKILHQIDLELASVTILFICFITNSDKKTFTSDTFFFQLKKKIILQKSYLEALLTYESR